jgi:hypothetical protein
MTRVGQDRIYKPNMTAYLVISLPKIPYIQSVCVALANLSDDVSAKRDSALNFL